MWFFLISLTFPPFIEELHAVQNNSPFLYFANGDSTCNCCGAALDCCDFFINSLKIEKVKSRDELRSNFKSTNQFKTINITSIDSFYPFRSVWMNWGFVKKRCEVLKIRTNLLRLKAIEK